MYTSWDGTQHKDSISEYICALISSKNSSLNDYFKCQESKQENNIRNSRPERRGQNTGGKKKKMTEVRKIARLTTNEAGNSQ